MDQQQVAGRLSKVCILIVDDDHTMVQLVRQVLASLGFTNVHVAHNGREALDFLNRTRADLIITDWLMTPVDGIELVHRLRSDPDSVSKFVPIIMLTGYAERQDVERARDAGITEFIAKPFTVRTLCDRIIAVVEAPRDFVISPRFTGPDRPRHGNAADSVGERRKRKLKKENPQQY